VITVTNKGAVPLQNITVADSFDAVFAPKSDTDMQATDRHRREGSRLIWNIANLPPGASAQFEIRTKCQFAAKYAYNRVKVTAADGSEVNKEVGLEIRSDSGAASDAARSDKNPADSPTAPADAGELSLLLPGSHNPISLHKRVTYRVHVSNSSSKTYRQVVLTVLLPNGMVPSSMGTQGHANMQFKADVGKGLVTFEPFEVQPNVSLSFEVCAVAKELGQGEVKAELSGPDLPQPLVQTISAEVVQ
jgi:uncharacterized repeat protein (TIGR01451 family)